MKLVEVRYLEDRPDMMLFYSAVVVTDFKKPQELIGKDISFLFQNKRYKGRVLEVGADFLLSGSGVLHLTVATNPYDLSPRPLGEVLRDIG